MLRALSTVGKVAGALKNVRTCSEELSKTSAGLSIWSVHVVITVCTYMTVSLYKPLLYALEYHSDEAWIEAKA